MSLFFQKFWYNFRILTSQKVFTVCSTVWKGEESESRPINRRGDVTLTALVGVRTSRAPLTEGPRLVSVFPPASSSPAAQINALLPKQRKYLWAAIKSEIIMRPLSQNMNLADSWFTRYHELLVKEVEPRIPPPPAPVFTVDTLKLHDHLLFSGKSWNTLRLIDFAR